MGAFLKSTEMDFVHLIAANLFAGVLCRYGGACGRSGARGSGMGAILKSTEVDFVHFIAANLFAGAPF